MFANIANTFANCFKIPELKSRILFTLMVLAICRVLACVPLPGLDARRWRASLESHAAKRAIRCSGCTACLRAVLCRTAPSVRWASCLTSRLRLSSSF